MTGNAPGLGKALYGVALESKDAASDANDASGGNHSVVNALVEYNDDGSIKEPEYPAGTIMVAEMRRERAFPARHLGYQKDLGAENARQGELVRDVVAEEYPDDASRVNSAVAERRRRHEKRKAKKEKRKQKVREQRQQRQRRGRRRLRGDAFGGSTTRRFGGWAATTATTTACTTLSTWTQMQRISSLAMKENGCLVVYLRHLLGRRGVMRIASTRMRRRTRRRKQRETNKEASDERGKKRARSSRHTG